MRNEEVGPYLVVILIQLNMRLEVIVSLIEEEA